MRQLPGCATLAATEATMSKLGMSTLTLAVAALLVCCGKGDTSETDGGPGIIGDGITPVVEKAEYACFEDANGGKFFYFRITANDQQGADTIESSGTAVLFKDSSGTPLDWNNDGTPDPENFLTLVCETDSDPRRCNGSLLESDISGVCAGTSLKFEGWATDSDGNESEHTEDFEVNSAILPTG